MEALENMINVTVTWRGNQYVIKVNSGAFLKELGDELQKLTDVKAGTLRLIVPQLSGKGSRMLQPFSDEHSCLSLQEASIVGGKSIMMMGVPEIEVDRVVQGSKVDLRIAGFDEEERRLRQRLSDGSRVSLKLPQGQYIFCDFRTLQIPGVELHPPASEALKRMHMLASDPGIVAIMNKHRWRVGIMTEMAPVGYVGVSPKCILGFNKNQGEEISLRLRTDDLKGFRKYESIKKTLLHELAHMVFSEHDSNFYALDKQLNEEAASLDWTKSRGHTLNGIQHSENNEVVYVEDGRTSQKLGGTMTTLLENARASSVAAAYRRLVYASASIAKASIMHDEPDPDDSASIMHDGNENLDILNPIGAELKLAHEPDPDYNSSNQKNFEPNVDDSDHGEALQLSPDTDFSKTNPQKTLEKSCKEPDPDDSGVSMRLGNVVETIDEPDPDDRAVEWNNLGCAGIGKRDQGHYIISETMEEQAHLNLAYKEPDPDASKANEITQEEPDPDDKLGPLLGVSNMKVDEPDPDESKANEITQEEPDPDDNLGPLLGVSNMKVDEPDPDDQELRRIQDNVTAICSRLQKAIQMLQAEVNPTDTAIVLQTLFKIIRNLIEHPNEIKFRRLRKANPIIQRNIANCKAAMEILLLIGFSEDVILNELGNSEIFLVLKRDDPGLLWLAKSSLETCITF